MISENLALFMADFSLPAFVPGGAVKAVVLDIQGEDISDGRVQINRYEMSYITTDFPGLGYQSPITVNGASYTVQTTDPIDDGLFSRAALKAGAP